MGINMLKCLMNRNGFGTNIDWMRGKTGGVGFVIKSDMECQRIICDSELLLVLYRLEHMLIDIIGF